LHLKEGLAAVKEKVASGKVVRRGPAPVGRANNTLAPMIRAPYFVVDHYELREPQAFGTQDESGKSSVQILVATEGCGILEAPGMEPVTLAKGDAAVVPASVAAFGVRPQWSVSFLKANVPGVDYPEPETRL
jgi:mannose-6-phosphate isomerase class I